MLTLDDDFEGAAASLDDVAVQNVSFGTATWRLGKNSGLSRNGSGAAVTDTHGAITTEYAELSVGVKADMRVSAIVNSNGDSAIFARLQPDDTESGYQVRITSSALILYRMDNGGATQLDSVAMTPTDGDTIEIECTGTTIIARGLDGGVPVETDPITDSDYATGYPGIRGFSTASGLKSFEAEVTL